MITFKEKCDRVEGRSEDMKTCVTAGDQPSMNVHAITINDHALA